MKAYLLAAGLGTRLRPLTNTVPKCLLPIRGVPLLEIWLKLCAQAQITSVLINVHAHAHAVKAFLAARTLPVEVHIAEEPTLLGSAGTLAANRRWVEGHEHFFVLYGDVLTNANLRAIAERHCRRNVIATLALNRVADPSRCGVATLRHDGIVTDFHEKPVNPASNMVFSGIMVARSEFLNFLPNDVPADIGYHVLPRIAGKMAGYELTDYLTDIGTMNAYHEVQQSWPVLKQEHQC